MNSSYLLKEALKFDAEKKDFVAFTKYLTAINSLCSDMLEICKCDEVQLRTNTLADKKIKLLKECTERLDVIYYQIKNKGCSSIPTTTATTDQQLNLSFSRSDPMMEAIEKNKILMKKHQSKVETSNASASQLTSMNLALQRQLTENISLAKQMKIKKDAEREQCRHVTLEYIKKSKALQHLPEETKEFISEAKAYENDCPELRLYSQYIFEKKDSQPELLKNYFDALADYPDHPFVVKMKETGHLFLNDLQTKNEIDETFLISIRDMVDHILIQLSLLLCDCLRLDRSFCNFIKYELSLRFFNIIMPRLFQIYNAKCQNKEHQLKIIVDNPTLLSRLESSIRLTELDMDLLSEVCQQLTNLKFSSTPEQMFKNIVAVCQRFTVHQVSANADDIIAFLITVIITSKSFDIIASCSLMEDFITSEQATGEEGYCLTSLQAATNFLLDLSQESQIAIENKLISI